MIRDDAPKPPAAIPKINIPARRLTPATSALGSYGTPASKKKSKSSSPLVLLFVAVILGGSVFYAYRLFRKPNVETSLATEKHPVVPTSKSVPPAAKPPPSPPAEQQQPVTLYKAEVNKAEAVVAAHDANAKQVNGVLGETKPPEAGPATSPKTSAPNPPAVSAPQEKPPETPAIVFHPPSQPQAAPPAAKSQPETPPAVSQPAPQNARIEVSPVEEASPAFRAFIFNLHVNGVFQGKPPRALINGRTVSVGEMIDDQLGITFVGVDARQKRIFLRDTNGITLAKEY